ncbi:MULTISPECIES: ammonia-dependent NAD(+) synthetase [unclassified Granulicatella]|uniref:ammonia-dependent NAD(+) synthetase n=1 Tax=unclassified Granulicatella TaxID=2630493 RepID=UPI0010738934|nr:MULTISPECIES: ammonia-dependent NAD(+) synthetase [unclassified Granulicatella]MBF0780410.1 ammonia-dependent NAD(+) synthetase [Granulicatella sp. 19428wC4_WM01]TFU95448.1 ammonia-dependent NAD(+) synthetase [Granulicatella sp. WM01]
MRSLQREIIQTLHVKSTIHVEEEIRLSIDFMKNYLKKHPFLKTLVLGISGGQDSTLAGKLCQMAIEELRQDTKDNSYQFIAVRLPYGVQQDEEDAKRALQFIQADKVYTVNIKDAVNAAVSTLESQGVHISDFNKGNIKARQRMIVQYSIAGAYQGVVVGTDHAAEALTGFYTKYGDGGADIMPLWRLNKRQGRQMLQFLGADERLYLKVPIADLEEERPQLPDEVALGVTYQDIDDYLEGKEIDGQAAEKIEQWYTKTEHKRRMPFTVFDR